MSDKRKRSYSVMCSCAVCDRRFRASRTDAKYCSAKCRMTASRSRAVKNKQVNPKQAIQYTLADFERLINESAFQK